jgi:hypothetical protein
MLRSGEVFEKVIGRYYPKSDVSHWLVRAEATESFQLPTIEHSGRRVARPHRCSRVMVAPIGSPAVPNRAEQASAPSLDVSRRAFVCGRILVQRPIAITTFLSKCVGETEAAIRAVFERAQKLAPATRGASCSRICATVIPRPQRVCANVGLYGKVDLHPGSVEASGSRNSSFSLKWVFKRAYS